MKDKVLDVWVGREGLGGAGIFGRGEKTNEPGLAIDVTKEKHGSNPQREKKIKIYYFLQ